MGAEGGGTTGIRSIRMKETREGDERDGEDKGGREEVREVG